MMRPRNWLSRRDSSLVTVVMSTVTVTPVTAFPSMTSSPVTSWVRPAAVVLRPRSTSSTRYPASLPAVAFHVPSTPTAEASPDRVVDVAGSPEPSRVRRAGASSLISST